MKKYMFFTKRVLSFLIIALICFSMLPTLAYNDSIVSYESVDLSSYANGKFWVDVNDSSEYNTSQYGRTDFVSGTGVDKMAVQWPLSFRGGQYRDGNPSYGSTYPEQKSIISGNTTDGFKMTSKLTGVTYNMPRKTENVSEKEAIILNREGAAANWGGNGEMIKEKTIYVSGKYDKLHFIVATAMRDSGTASIDATVTYTDGTTSVLKSANIPSSCNTAQAESSNFFADVWTAGSDNASTNLDNYYNGKYTRLYILAMYEYSLELESDKTVESIHFITDRSDVTPSIAIAAVTMEKDWSQTLTVAENAIEDALQDSTNLDKILYAIDCMNEFEKSGLSAEEYISNYHEYLELISSGAELGNQLIAGIYENTEINWTNAEDLLERTVSIINAITAIGSSYDDLSYECREMCENAFLKMVEMLFDTENEMADKKEMLKVLNSTNVEAFDEILSGNIMWVSEYSAYPLHEYIVFELGFSQEIPEDLLCNEYLQVYYDDENVDEKHVSYEPIMIQGVTEGVLVKVLNIYGFENKYKLSLSDDIVGELGGKCFDKEFIELFVNPFELSTKNIKVSNEQIDGQLTFKNNLDKTQSYVATVIAYSKNNQQLDLCCLKGTVDANSEKTQDLYFALPEDTAEVYIYIMDSYMDMTLLTDSVNVK